MWSLIFDLLILVSGHTWRVANSAPPPSLKILWLSVLVLLELSFDFPYDTTQNAFADTAHAISRDLRIGEIFPHIFEIAKPDLPVH